MLEKSVILSDLFGVTLNVKYLIDEQYSESFNYMENSISSFDKTRIDRIKYFFLSTSIIGYTKIA